MQQNSSSNSSQFGEAPATYKASCAVLGLCFVLGVPGNIAVLRMLTQRLAENNFTLSLMLNLAISDLLTLLPVPVWIWSLLHGWTFGSVACKIISYIEYSCLYNSIVCVTLMSFQRYMQVLHPQKWAKLGHRGQKGLLAGIWILSGVLALYAPVQREVGFDRPQFQYCFQQFRSDAEKVGTALFEVLVFSMTFILMVYFYYRLYRGVNESTFSRSSRTTRLVTRIVVAFFVFGVPLAIVDILIVLAVLLKNDSLSVIVDLVGKVSTSLIFLNSCVNPFLYTFAFRQLHRRNTATDLVQTVQSSVRPNHIDS